MDTSMPQNALAGGVEVIGLYNLKFIYLRKMICYMLAYM